MKKDLIIDIVIIVLSVTFIIGVAIVLYKISAVTEYCDKSDNALTSIKIYPNYHYYEIGTCKNGMVKYIRPNDITIRIPNES